MRHSLLKISMWFLLAVVAYYTYHIVVRVLYLRFKYSKYPNVFMTPKFIPLLGDMSESLQHIEDNKFVCHSYRENALKKSGDLWLYLIGYNDLFMINSIAAL